MTTGTLARERVAVLRSARVEHDARSHALPVQHRIAAAPTRAMPPSASSSRCTLAGACTLIAFYTAVSVVYFRDHLLGRGAVPPPSPLAQQWQLAPTRAWRRHLPAEPAAALAAAAAEEELAALRAELRQLRSAAPSSLPTCI